jgi:shikimate kinase
MCRVFSFVDAWLIAHFGYNSAMQVIATPSNKYDSGNIFLVGMMGAGKTTIGKLLSGRQGKTFIDCDEEIQRRTGVTITHIFDIEGEAGFRKREAAVIQDLVQRKNIIMATGGGAILSEVNRKALSLNGIVVYLKGTVHDLWLRTRHDRNRPLLQTADPHTRLKELYKERDPLYAGIADLIIQSGKQSAQSLVSKLQNDLDLLTSSHTSSCKH